MRLAVSASSENAWIIRELLSVWRVSWVSTEDADVVIVYQRRLPGQSRAVLIPSNSIDSENWSKHSNQAIARCPGKRIFIEAAPKTELSLVSESSYESNLASLRPSVLDEDLIIPEFDLVEEYKCILRQTLNAGSSVVYRLATSFPLPYNIAPKRFRDYLMKKHDKHSRLNFCNVLPLDAVRFALVNAIERLSKQRLCKKTWDHRSCVCALTHDVETEKGLKRSRSIKKLEEKYDLPSAWFIPSRQYPLDHEIVQELGNNGEVGSHDTKHDGRLSQLSKSGLTQRLTEGKRNLESITNRPIEGFRAPLLQHTSRILVGLGECGFKYDTSIPTWEPKHPRTMSSHGVGTVFPIHIEGMNEIPITMIQDHQLLHVLCLTPKETIAEWLSDMAVVKKLGGICVFLSHPEYGLLDAQGLPSYEELLNTIASDHEMLVSSPSRILSPD